MSKIYEQIHVDRKPTGLYRHAGDMRNGKFIKATRPSGLKTMQQWRALEASTPTPGTTRWYCPNCLILLPVEQEADGTYTPCTQCGFSAWVGPRHVPQDDKYTMAYTGPDTLARVVELQRARREGLPLPAPVPAQMIRLGPPPKAFVATPMGDTTARVIARQRQLGQREPDLYAKLRTHEVKPCQRCGKADASQCPCPPAPPDVLAEAVKRQAIRLQLQQQADEAAYPALRTVQP